MTSSNGRSMYDRVETEVIEIDVPSMGCPSHPDSSQEFDSFSSSCGRRKRMSCFGDNGLCSLVLFYVRSNFKTLWFGQLVSLLVACTDAAQATLHWKCNLSAPTFTIALMYFCLSFHLVLLRSNGDEPQQQLTPLAQSDDEGDPQEGIITSTSTTIGCDGFDSESNNNNTGINCNDEIHSTENTIGTMQFTLPSRGSSSASTCNAPFAAPYSFLNIIPLHRPAWHYFLIAICDVEANYFTVLAFRYTTLTSVSLFDGLAIPSAMIFSKLLFSQRRYTWTHIVAVCVCMVGVFLNVQSDYESDKQDATKNDNQQDETFDAYRDKLKGDIFAILGGILYGLDDVCFELCVRAIPGKDSTSEFLGMMGFFAFLLAIVQTLVLERAEIEEFFGDNPNESSMCSLSMGWILSSIFVIAYALSYIGEARFLCISEATFFNLSCLTGDFWSVMFAVVAQHIVPPPSFFFALLFVISGVVIYEMAPTPVVDNDHLQDVPSLFLVVKGEEDDDDNQLGIEICDVQGINSLPSPS